MSKSWTISSLTGRATMEALGKGGTREFDLLPRGAVLHVPRKLSRRDRSSTKNFTASPILLSSKICRGDPWSAQRSWISGDETGNMQHFCCSSSTPHAVPLSKINIAMWSALWLDSISSIAAAPSEIESLRWTFSTFQTGPNSLLSRDTHSVSFVFLVWIH
jgi:hypothetical protein